MKTVLSDTKLSIKLVSETTNDIFLLGRYSMKLQEMRIEYLINVESSKIVSLQIANERITDILSFITE